MVTLTNYLFMYSHFNYLFIFPLTSGHLSFSFDFFLHGESTVCASVDVRQHPAVRTLLYSHLQQAQAVMHSAPPVNGNV